MGIKVFISLERQECVAGDVVEGLVQVEVPAVSIEKISRGFKHHHQLIARENNSPHLKDRDLDYSDPI